jgi:hypothetical protein
VVLVVIVGSAVELLVLVDEVLVVVVVGRQAARPPHRATTLRVHRFGRGAFSKARTQFDRAHEQARSQRRADGAALPVTARARRRPTTRLRVTWSGS